MGRDLNFFGSLPTPTAIYKAYSNWYHPPKQPSTFSIRIESHERPLCPPLARTLASPRVCGTYLCHTTMPIHILLPWGWFWLSFRIGNMTMARSNSYDLPTVSRTHSWKLSRGGLAIPKSRLTRKLYCSGRMGRAPKCWSTERKKLLPILYSPNMSSLPPS